MKQDEKSAEFYKRLRQQLQDDTTWPSQYLYKFIVPANLEKIAEIEAVFNGTDATSPGRRLRLYIIPYARDYFLIILVRKVVLLK